MNFAPGTRVQSEKHEFTGRVVDRDSERVVVRWAGYDRLFVYKLGYCERHLKEIANEVPEVARTENSNCYSMSDSRTNSNCYSNSRTVTVTPLEQ